MNDFDDPIDVIELAKQAGFPDWWIFPPELERQHSEARMMLERFAGLIFNQFIEELKTAERCDPYTGEPLECASNEIIRDQISWLQYRFGVE